MKKWLIIAAVLAAALAVVVFAFRYYSRPVQHLAMSDEVIFDAGHHAEFRTKWDDGGSTGATYEIDGRNRLTITGIEKNKTYGSVYKDILIDLDRYAAIEVTVETVSKGAYILLQGSAFEEGYVSLGPSISAPGVARYDLRLQTGYTSGKLAVRLQIGVTTNTAVGSSEGLVLTLSSLRFIPRDDVSKQELPGRALILDQTREILGDVSGEELMIHALNEGEGSLYRFAGHWDDGAPSGAEAVASGGDLVIEGRNEKDMYGAVVVNATVDLDQRGGLIVNVKEVTKAGYIIFQHPDLPGGFVRAQPEILKPGVYKFDMRRLLGRSGLATFKILFGVSTQGTAPSVKGQRMVISLVALGAAPLRAIEKISRVTALTAMPAPDPPSGSPWPTAAALRPDRLAWDNGILPGIEILKSVSPTISAKGDRIVVRGGLTEIILSAKSPRVIEVRDLASNKIVSTGGALFAIETPEEGVLDAEAAFQSGKAKCDVKIDSGSGGTRVRYRVEFTGYNVDLVVTPRDGGVALSADVVSMSQRVQGVMLPGKFLYPIAALKEVVIPRWLGIGLRPAFFHEERTASFNYPAGFSDFVHASSDAGYFSLLGGGLPGTGLPGTPQSGGSGPESTERRGNLMRYSGEGIRGADGASNVWTGMRPATISVGGELGAGFVTRMIPARIDPGQTLSTGEVLIAAGLPLSSTAALYRSRIYQDDVKPLAARMGEKLFAAYSRAALVKLDFGGYSGIERILDDVAQLPEGILLHPVTYWTGGFDRNYPDFYPADPKFSGNAGLKNLTNRAHERKMLVVPYVNPTWWNKSATAERIGLDKIAIRDEEDKPIEDVYGENRGWMVTPWSDEVRDVRIKLHATTHDELGMDGVFEDQIGARDWKDDYSRNAPAPFSYSEGMVRWAADYKREGILMTENGFDAIAPFEHSLCGMWPVGTWPATADLDARYGNANWRVVPVSSMIAHDLADFLHHNLAVEARTDADAKLAWNIAYGFHLFEIQHANLPKQHARWIAICQTFQEEVNSLTTGRKLIEWAQQDGAPSAQESVWTRYEAGLPGTGLPGTPQSGGRGISAFANLGRQPREIPGATISAPGVIAGDDRMTAGIFSSIAGFDLGMPRHIIMKRGANDGAADGADEISIIIPDDHRGLIAIPRDPSRRNAAAFAVEQMIDGSKRNVECAITDQAIVFLHKPGRDGIGRYRVITSKPSATAGDVSVGSKSAGADAGAGAAKVDKPGDTRAGDFAGRASLGASDWFARLRAPARITAGTSGRIRLELFAGGEPIEVSAHDVRAWTVNRTGPVPSREMNLAATKNRTKLSAHQWAGASFDISVPDDVAPGEYLWVSAKIMTDRGEKTVSTIAPIDPGIIVTCDVDTVVRMASEIIVGATLVNRTSRDVTGRLELLIDRATVTTPFSSTDITVKAATATGAGAPVGGTWSGSIPAAALSRGPHKISLRFQTKQGIVVPSAPRSITAVEPLRGIDLDGRNLIPAGGMTVKLHLTAPEGRGFRGVASFTGDGGWTAKPATCAVNVAPGGEAYLPIKIIPGNARIGKIIVRISGPDGEISHVEPYQLVDKDPVILRDDLNGDGLKDVAFGHESLEAQCAPAAGGRILLLAGREGINHLYLKYPPRDVPADPRAWIEMGGINDWWPRGWPGDVWNNEWKIESRFDQTGAHTRRACIEMSSASQDGLTIRRSMTIASGANVMICDYEIGNPTAAPISHLWAAHPDIAVGPGGAGREDRMVVPTERGLRQHDYRPRLAKVSFFRPTGGWAAAHDRTSGDFIALLYEQGALSEIGAWEGIGFFTMEPVRAQKELQPGEKDIFRIGYGIGRGDPGVFAPEMAKRMARK